MGTLDLRCGSGALSMMRFITCFTRNVCVAAAACWWVGGSPSLANEDRWKAAVNGVWSVGSNWVDGSTPGNSDGATFNVGGAYTVTFNADPSAIQWLRVLDGGAVTFTSSSFLQPSTVRVTSEPFSDVFIASSSTLTIGSAGGILQPDKPLHLTAVNGVNVHGTLNVRFGSEVNAAHAYVRALGATLNVTDGSRVISGDGNIGNAIVGGAANVSGNGSQWINSGTLTIGKGVSDPLFISDGHGTLLISGGGLVEDANATVGEGFNSQGQTAFGVGVVTVTGDGSEWKTINDLRIGDLGDGAVNIQPGGTVRVGGNTVLYSGGSVRLQGGTLDIGEMWFTGEPMEQLEWSSGRFSVRVFHQALGNYGSGVLAPGNSGAGSAAIAGLYEQGANGALEIEIGGAAQASQYDVVNVGGQAALNGFLDLKLINGFVPSPSQTFIIMTTGIRFSGAFANAVNGQRVTTLDGGGSFLVHYGPGSSFDPTLMVLSDFRAAGIPGDFNKDGEVDRDDLLQWQGDFGQNGVSDADADGDSDGADFLVWQRHLGSPPPPAATIPEPAAGALSLLGALGLRIPRIRRKPC